MRNADPPAIIQNQGDLMMYQSGQYVEPTDIIDSDHPDIRAFAAERSAGATNPVGKAVCLYYAVRDGIRYDPYYPFYKPEHYRY